ncbi:DUF4214 domain-containing protein [Rhodoferax sp. 4810]|uniref:DUF4214 domain-containing protein n=1 Tax=Thiospirillum jenense TaxID=1653858 RepID=A0A839HCW8_9GAMM|nr:DUF4214 domain-containing protein [Thiospirillum jenense]MBB1073090.1 DUF4214 domain-containing protein [Rhodoferax jenense]MBB1125037.1 DUF4214 domain-containing protein [Thiospirillum jenense]
MRFSAFAFATAVTFTTMPSFATEVFSAQGWERGGDSFNISISRSDDNVITMDIELVEGHPFICSGNFVVIQNNVQYNGVSLKTVTGDSQCGDVYINSTFTLTYNSYSTPPDWSQAFTLIYDDYTAEIPATINNAQLMVFVIGQGHVVSDLAGIDCSTLFCTSTFPINSAITLTAIPSDGWLFKEWQRGRCNTNPVCPGTLSSSKQAVAVFEPIITSSQRAIQLIVMGNGQVTSQPDGLSCGANSICNAIFNAGDSLTLTASDNNGFIGWGGLCAAQGTVPVCTVAIDDLFLNDAQNQQIIASFNTVVREQTTRWKIAELYMATVGYAMDAEGLNYWINQVDSGAMTLEEVAQSFFEQPLVTEMYPATLNDGRFIDEVYRNIFGREADTDGRNYWITELNNDRSRDYMIVMMINGGWANQSVDAQSDMMRFKHRTEVALAFADYQNDHNIIFSQLNSANQSGLIVGGTNILAGVTQDVATRDEAIAIIPALLTAVKE